MMLSERRKQNTQRYDWNQPSKQYRLGKIIWTKNSPPRKTINEISEGKSYFHICRDSYLKVYCPQILSGEKYLKKYSSKQKSNPREWEIQNPRNKKNNPEGNKIQDAWLFYQANGHKFRTGRRIALRRE